MSCAWPAAIPQTRAHKGEHIARSCGWTPDGISKSLWHRALAAQAPLFTSSCKALQFSQNLVFVLDAWETPSWNKTIRVAKPEHSCRLWEEYRGRCVALATEWAWFLFCRVVFCRYTWCSRVHTSCKGVFQSFDGCGWWFRSFKHSMLPPWFCLLSWWCCFPENWRRTMCGASNFLLAWRILPNAGYASNTGHLVGTTDLAEMTGSKHPFFLLHALLMLVLGHLKTIFTSWRHHLCLLEWTACHAGSLSDLYIYMYVHLDLLTTACMPIEKNQLRDWNLRKTHGKTLSSEASACSYIQLQNNLKRSSTKKSWRQNIACIVLSRCVVNTQKKLSHGRMDLYWAYSLRRNDQVCWVKLASIIFSIASGCSWLPSTCKRHACTLFGSAKADCVPVFPHMAHGNSLHLSSFFLKRIV